MSESSPPERRRRVRAEARRNVAAILDAAIQVLGQRPQATMDDIAAAAGLSRQTVYAHFPSRDALVTAVFRRMTDEVLAGLDAARLDEGPAPAALRRLLEVSWRTFDRYPPLPAPTGAADVELHQPVHDRLTRLILRGQRAGEFDRDAAPGWLVAATIALGHAAWAEVVAGRMPADQAVAAVQASVLRVYGAEPAD
ncbi:TetR/AcrR family transcriptional regulator [Micromonospora eburnea]|uniref:Transcriptional regulator, TetR family n=1 Tax=Micromonospora eburnea TaxID=227316 RepID=A0A1C6UPY4_9ACTN|nr:TetR/AcrR family transcriptional regulator [Micromonospora eburnea]SCL56086.1 transcriptional regulator, TetR family [Micromonospora eburnea]